VQYQQSNQTIQESKTLILLGNKHIVSFCKALKAVVIVIAIDIVTYVSLISHSFSEAKHQLSNEAALASGKPPIGNL